MVGGDYVCLLTSAAGTGVSPEQMMAAMAEAGDAASSEQERCIPALLAGWLQGSCMYIVHTSAGQYRLVDLLISLRVHFTSNSMSWKLELEFSV